MGRRKISPELLERVRDQFRKDPKDQRLHAAFRAMGQARTPYEPDEVRVQARAGRIAYEEEKDQLIDKLVDERPEITTLYAKYQTATPERKLQLASALIPLLTERIAELAKRTMGTSLGSCPCKSQGDQIEDLYTRMSFLEGYVAYNMMRKP